MIKYRPDIDGIRCIAVLSVLSFHLGITYTPGGFVGVDVFFVISGFLIGSSVYNNIRNDRFSIIDFYERRFRRIFPALFFVLICVTAVAFWLSFPDDYIRYAKSLFSAALSWSNVYFWATSGYFSPQADSQPLLHTWSLGVEEQFYIIFPLLTYLLWSKASKAFVYLFAALAAVSFAVAAWGAFRFPTATFYWLPMRAWELLLGFAVVLVPLPWLRRSRVRQIAALLGLVLIFASIFFLQARWPFPGVAALPSCFGTALLIAAGGAGENSVSKALSLRPMVGVGLISYSLYLWHWPLIVFARHGLDVQINSAWVRLCITALALGLATLSWRYVERPFRDRHRVSRRAVFTASATAVLASSAVAFVVIAGAGFPARFSPRVNYLASFAALRKSNDQHGCFIDSATTIREFDFKNCLTPDPRRPSVLLIGDSQAAHLSAGLRSRFPQIKLLQATASGCRSLLTDHPTRPPRCGQLRTFVYRKYLPSHHIDLVILSGRWAAEDIPALTDTLRWAKRGGIDIVVSGPIPEYDEFLPELLARAAQLNDPRVVTRHMNGSRALVDKLIGATAAAAGTPYVSPYKLLCDGTFHCKTVDDHGTPLQKDRSHLTPAGSRSVASLFDGFIDKLD